MNKGQNLLAALALSGMAACSAEQASQDPERPLQETAEAGPEIGAIVENAQNHVFGAVEGAEEIFAQEEQAWNDVMLTQQAQDLALEGRVEMLLSARPGDSGFEAFNRYLNIIVANRLPIEVLFERGLLSESIYTRYMDVAADLIIKKSRFEQCVADPTLIENCGRTADRNLYPEEIEITQRLIDFIRSGDSAGNPVDGIFDVSSTIDMSQLGPSFTEMTKSVNNPLLALAIMLRETFPGAPRNNQFDARVRLAIASSMLAAGYSPNFKPAEDNNHLTLAFPHITYPTGVNLCITANNRAPQFLRLPDYASTEECYYAIATDPEIAMKAYLLLSYDDVNRFENFVYANIPSGPTQNRILNFMNDATNRHAFAAIGAHFNFYGATGDQYRYLLSKMSEADYIPERFIELISAGEQGDYVNKVMTYYRYLQSVREALPGILVASAE